MTNFFKDSNTKPLAIAITICAILLLGFAAWFISMGKPANAITERELYALATVVREVDREGDIVTCEDYNGNLWDFYGAEDWQEGDNANLLMDTCGTPNIYDDEIRGASFGAWILTK